MSHRDMFIFRECDLETGNMSWYIICVRHCRNISDIASGPPLLLISGKRSVIPERFAPGCNNCLVWHVYAHLVLCICHKCCGCWCVCVYICKTYTHGMFAHAVSSSVWLMELLLSSHEPDVQIVICIAAFLRTNVGGQFSLSDRFCR
jgi:hypothetical protein